MTEEPEAKEDKEEKKEEEKETAKDDNEVQKDGKQAKDQKEEEKGECNLAALKKLDKPPEAFLKILKYEIYEGDTPYGRLAQLNDKHEKFAWKGQVHYDFIADKVTEWIQHKIVERYGLHEIWMPEDKDLEEEYRHLPRCNIFMTEDFRNVEKSAGRNGLVLI